jgi:hypothetical protein
MEASFAGQEDSPRPISFWKMWRKLVLQRLSDHVLWHDVSTDFAIQEIPYGLEHFSSKKCSHFLNEKVLVDDFIGFVFHICKGDANRGLGIARFDES